MGVLCAPPTMLSITEQASCEAYTTLPLRARGQRRQLVARAGTRPATAAIRDITGVTSHGTLIRGLANRSTTTIRAPVQQGTENKDALAHLHGDTSAHDKGSQHSCEPRYIEAQSRATSLCSTTARSVMDAAVPGLFIMNEAAIRDHLDTPMSGHFIRSGHTAVS